MQYLLDGTKLIHCVQLQLQLQLSLFFILDGTTINLIVSSGKQIPYHVINTL